MEMKALEIKPLLLIGGQSSRMGSRKELLPFPDQRLAIEHALATLHSASPDASSIYISLHSTDQLQAIQFILEEPHPESALQWTGPNKRHTNTHNHDHYHDHRGDPTRVPIFDDQHADIGPAAGLLAAHTMFPDATFLVIGCDYPLLPPAALEQLSLDYTAPATCFVNESGFAEPLIAVWGPEALKQLEENVAHGRNGLSGTIKQVNGKMVKPLREEWIRSANTKEEWDKIMDLLLERWQVVGV